jgi:hypothetical protein
MSKRSIITFLIIVLPVIKCFAEDPDPFKIYPELPDQAASLNEFIPVGWSLKDSVSGFLTDSPEKDLVMVIQLDDTLLLNKIVGDDTMTEELRPRVLLIVSSTPDKRFLKRCQANQAIMPESEGDTAGDPFSGMEILNKDLHFSFKGGLDLKWNLSYRFRYHKDGFYLIQATSKGEGKDETYSFSYDLISGELNIEVSDLNDPSENMKYSKIRIASDQPRLENFLPLSYVVDQSEGIIF